MNKVYRVIWSKVKHAYVVVSEIAKNRTKHSESIVNSHRNMVALCVVLLCSGVNVAGATIVVGAGNGVAVGTGSNAPKAENVAIGKNATISYSSGKVSIATKDVTFPDVPKNHWAYTYVKSLADKGYLEGYPDGEFKSDRAMTRYEYATVIYHALQNGAPNDADMSRAVEEFKPELIKVQDVERFRVDRISGKDNDRHKIERVRVNDKNDKVNHQLRDVYGSHIEK